MVTLRDWQDIEIQGLTNLFCWLQENGERSNARDNPHKYLLYKPTFGQLNTFLASAFKELPPNGAMVLYISADGCQGNQKHTDDGKLAVEDLLRHFGVV